MAGIAAVTSFCCILKILAAFNCQCAYFIECTLAIVIIILGFFAFLIMVILFIYDFCFILYLFIRDPEKRTCFFFRLVSEYWNGILVFLQKLCSHYIWLTALFLLYCMLHDVTIFRKKPLSSMLFKDYFLEELACFRFDPLVIIFYLAVVIPVRLAYWFDQVFFLFLCVTLLYASFFKVLIYLYIVLYAMHLYNEFEWRFLSVTAVMDSAENALERINNSKKK